MRTGFTLAETAVASVIILIVLSAFAFVLTAFMNGSRSLELQQGALTLARVEMARIERRHTLPEPGRSVRPDSLWSHVYQIDTTVSAAGENAINVLVAVASEDAGSIELSRRFYFE